MSKKRFKLIAARVETNLSQEQIATNLNEKGFTITTSMYRDIELGRHQRVEVELAFAIAKEVCRSVEEIFLTKSA